VLSLEGGSCDGGSHFYVEVLGTADSYITNLNISNENMFFAPLLASWNSVTFKSVPAKQNPR